MRQYSNNQIECDLKEAQLCHARLDPKRAIFILKNSIERFDLKSNASSVDSHIKSLDLYAQLLDETKSESPSVIIRDHLEKAVDLIDQHDLISDKNKTTLIRNSFFRLQNLPMHNINILTII